MSFILDRMSRRLKERSLIGLEIPRFQGGDEYSQEILRRYVERYDYLTKELLKDGGKVLAVTALVVFPLLLLLVSGSASENGANSGITKYEIAPAALNTEAAEPFQSNDSEGSFTSQRDPVDKGIEQEVEANWMPRPGGNTKEDAAWVSRDIRNAKSWEELEEVIRFHDENGR